MRSTTRADALAATALAIADREGLAKVTIRRVAREHGIAPMTVYGTVASKAELVGLLAQKAYQDLELPSLDGGWKENLFSLMAGYRGLLLRHPSLIQIYAAQRVSLAALGHARFVDAVLGELERGGVPAEQAVAGLLGLQDFALGFVLFERPRTAPADIEPREASAIADLNEVMRIATANELPALARHATEIFGHRASDSFESSVMLLIEGIGRHWVPEAVPD